MHILDLIMYFVTAGLLWFIMDKISGGDLTEEIGVVIGWMIMLVYTIIYIILFAFCSYNWIDIYHSIINCTLSIKL